MTNDSGSSAPEAVTDGNGEYVKTRSNGEPWIYKNKDYARVPRRPGIYFMGSAQEPDVFKLGISLHTPLANRMQVTQVHYPHRLSVALFVPVDDMRFLRSLESRLQREPWFKACLTRPRCSWYRLDKSTRTRVKEWLAKELETENGRRP